MPATRKETSDVDRQKIIDSYLSGNAPKTIAGVLGLKKGAVYAAIALYNTQNRITKLARGRPRQRKLTDLQCEQIRSWVDADSSISLVRLKELCLTEFDLEVSTTTIERRIQDFHYSLKRINCQPERRNDEEALHARATYATSFMQVLATSAHERIFFLDEAGFSVSMRARRGRSLRGTRAVHVVGSIRSRNISLMCAMNKSGIFHYTVQTRAYNTETFSGSLRTLFEKMRTESIQNAVLITDNVAFHRTRSVRELVEANGHRLMFLPPYSPFLNPIENLFSKWKEAVRRSKPQNEDSLLRLIEEGSSLITAENCDSYFRHMLGFLERCLNRTVIIDE
jgi:transposase